MCSDGVLLSWGTTASADVFAHEYSGMVGKAIIDIAAEMFWAAEQAVRASGTFVPEESLSP